MANFPSQELAQDKNPHGEPPAPELKGKHLSHATGAQPATQPAANPLFASEPWNLVADGYAEFWDNMPKGSAPIQMMKKPIMSVRGEISVRGEPVEPHSDSIGEALWCEKEKLALTWLNFMAYRPSVSMNKSGAIWNGSRRTSCSS